MSFDQKKIAQEQIWTYLPIEQDTNQRITQAIGQKTTIAYLIVDSLFLQMPKAWETSKLVITDNIPMRNVSGCVLELYPEYWHVYHYHPSYLDRPATYGYNCFMNRICQDRGRPGLANSTAQDILDYGEPYNNLVYGLEQCVIDSNIGVILETYISDDHIAFSEKIFRALQLPRPWMLYCSPQAVGYLRRYGFDVLDDYVDHSYDNQPIHSDRLQCILDQLETFVHRQYSPNDYDRFKQAADHNRNLLLKFSHAWPAKLAQALDKIKQHD
jgi:hypothetical protein